MPSHVQLRMSCIIILRSCPIALHPAQMQHAADVLCCLSHCDGMECIWFGDGQSCPVLERQQGDSWPWWCRRGRGWSVVADSHAHCLTWTQASLKCSHCRAAGAAAAADYGHSSSVIVCQASLLTRTVLALNDQSCSIIMLVH